MVGVHVCPYFANHLQIIMPYSLSMLLYICKIGLQSLINQGGRAWAQTDGSLFSPVAAPVFLTSGLLLKRVCHNGLVVTAGRVSYDQEQAPKKRYVHCSVYRGFLQSLESATALPPAFPVSSGPREHATADYPSRCLIENALLSVDHSSFCTLLFNRLLIIFVVLTCEQYRCSYPCEPIYLFWTPPLSQGKIICLAVTLKHPKCSKITLYLTWQQLVFTCAGEGRICDQLAVANGWWAQPCQLLWWLCVSILSNHRLSDRGYWLTAFRAAG